jgi:hypothetical protein
MRVGDSFNSIAQIGYPKMRCLLPLPIEILPFSTEALEVVWILYVDRLQVNVFASDRVLSKYEQ